MISSRPAQLRPLRRAIVAAGILAAALLALAPAHARAADASLTAKVSFDSSVVSGPLDGRAYLLVRPGAGMDPLSSLSSNGQTKLFGKDVSGVLPESTISLSGGGDGFDGVYGYPYASLDQLPSGTYTVRAFFNTYETAHRSDGSTVSVHFPCGDGGSPWRSPGNLESDMQTVTIDRSQPTQLALDLTTKLQPSQPVPAGGTCQQGNVPESAHVKHVKLRSAKLSAFWGRDIYVAADVLLPWDYDDPANADRRYPVVYLEGHYTTSTPYSFKEDGSTAFSAWWQDPASPQMIVVQFRTENPFYDDSYVVNSPNLGPYGDAVNDEMIPKIDADFRTIAEPYARALTGGSTGGWITVANMIFRPDLFGSAWAGYPDSLDFHAHQILDLYDSANAYQTPAGDLRPSSHLFDPMTGVDTVTLTMADENHFELAVGNRSRSLVGQWDIWNAAFGAQGANCYPLEPWDKVSGAIVPGAVDRWRGMDMSQVLRDNWDTLGPVLRGKLHVWVGTQDTYYLNGGVTALQNTIQALSGSSTYAQFRYGEGAKHGYSPYPSTQDMLTDIAGYIAAHTPAPGESEPDLSSARGNLWADVSQGSCATRNPVPSIAGSAASGQTLTADPGDWDPGVELAYQWQRDGAAIGGATDASYTVAPADAGAKLSVAVTGTKLGYDTKTATSAPVTVVVPPGVTPVPGYVPPVPTIAGTVRVGLTLAARPGSWPAGVALSYQWYRNGVAIAGATNDRYTLAAADRGTVVSVHVSGTLPGQTAPAVGVSAATARVSAGRIAKISRPKLTGSARVGGTLRAKRGAWSAGVKFSYRWFRNGKKIAGATRSTYKVKSRDRGKKLMVRVSGRKSGYATVGVSSPVRKISRR